MNDVYPDSETTLDAALELASAIAANSPLVVQGAKKILNRSEDEGRGRRPRLRGRVERRLPAIR